MIIVLKLKRFSAPGLNNERFNNCNQSNKNPRPKTLNTSGGVVGFNRNRNYDQDFNRLGKNDTLRQLTQTNTLQDEMRKLNTELNEGRRGKWLDT